MVSEGDTESGSFHLEASTERFQALKTFVAVFASGFKVPLRIVIGQTIGATRLLCPESARDHLRCLN